MFMGNFLQTFRLFMYPSNYIYYWNYVGILSIYENMFKQNDNKNEIKADLVLKGESGTG